MIIIDGSFGEGGGQILRTSLSLSMITGKPFHIRNIRANRKKPGLMRQHLTSVNAAAEISNADVKGDALGSCELYFAPKQVIAGKYHFSIGTAGSCTLVLQTVLPALLTAGNTSELILEGGTHNPFAPPFDFIAKTFLPIINRMGATVQISLESPGFYPAGGGKIRAEITPSSVLSKIDLTERGEIKRHQVRAMVANLSETIGEREIRYIQKKRAEWNQNDMRVENISNSKGPGNAVVIEIESGHITEVFTGFGKRGVRAEDVAERTLHEAQEYIDADAPTGKHLADQLLIYMAVSGGGKIRTLSPSQHTETNIKVIKEFIDADISSVQISDKVWEIAVKQRDFL